MSLQDTEQTHKLVCFPRVSGDEPILVAFALVREEFSPRERG